MDKYEILEQVGKGSFGSVTKIRRKEDKKIMVWKEINYGRMKEKEKQQLVSEVNILREFRHPHIVKYYDRIVDKANSRIYIVMEYCEKGDLGCLIKKYKREKEFLAEDLIWKIFIQILLALQACHNKEVGKILHRDIKPGNVLLDANMNAKLADFGLSRVMGENSIYAETKVGTPYYMSPEQIADLKYNEKSDIWSTGCLLYEMTTLNPPFQAKSHAELASKINKGYVERIPSRYSEDLQRVISWMMSLDFNLRPKVDEILNLPPIVVRNKEKGVKDNAARVREVENRLKEREERARREREELKKREEDIERREKAVKRNCEGDDKNIIKLVPVENWGRDLEEAKIRPNQPIEKRVGSPVIPKNNLIGMRDSPSSRPRDSPTFPSKTAAVTNKENFNNKMRDSPNLTNKPPSPTLYNREIINDRQRDSPQITKKLTIFAENPNCNQRDSPTIPNKFANYLIPSDKPRDSPVLPNKVTNYAVQNKENINAKPKDSPNIPRRVLKAEKVFENLIQAGLQRAKRDENSAAPERSRTVNQIPRSPMLNKDSPNRTALNKLPPDIPKSRVSPTLNYRKEFIPKPNVFARNDIKDFDRRSPGVYDRYAYRNIENKDPQRPATAFITNRKEFYVEKPNAFNYVERRDANNGRRCTTAERRYHNVGRESPETYLYRKDYIYRGKIDY